VFFTPPSSFLPFNHICVQVTTTIMSRQTTATAVHQDVENQYVPTLARRVAAKDAPSMADQENVVPTGKQTLKRAALGDANTHRPVISLDSCVLDTNLPSVVLLGCTVTQGRQSQRLGHGRCQHQTRSPHERHHRHRPRPSHQDDHVLGRRQQHGLGGRHRTAHHIDGEHTGHHDQDGSLG